MNVEEITKAIANLSADDIWEVKDYVDALVNSFEEEENN